MSSPTAIPPVLQDADETEAAGSSGSLLGCTQEDLERIAVAHGEPAYRGRQLFAAVFARRARSFEAMTDLPRRLREALEGRYELARPPFDAMQAAADGTRKYRFTAGHTTFEAVYIPEVARESRTNTLCISSQTGCGLGCAFCFTASLRRLRNLTAAEIVGQVLAVAEDVEQLGPDARISNIVFMGMGEPLLNYREVVRAARILTAPQGLDFSSRRVTVSTAGVAPRIPQLGREVDTQLALSLNATTDAVRDRIMPINRKWPLDELLAAVRAYPLRRRRRVTIEYVLLDGVNDSDEDARRLARLLAGIPVKINLLPLNPHERTPLAPPPPERVERLQQMLLRAGLNAIVRRPRGRDIAAACGQLGGRDRTR